MQLPETISPGDVIKVIDFGGSSERLTVNIKGTQHKF
jgi:hypothetical protein